MDLHDELNQRVARTTWRIQRLLWIVMAGALAAGALGFFGSGPLSRQTVSSSSGAADVSLEYERWTRLRTAMNLTVTVDAPEATGGLSIALDEAFTGNVSIDGLSPPPDSSSPGGGHVYRWSDVDWSGQVTVEISYAIPRANQVDGEIEVTAGDQPPAVLSFKQFAVP